MICSVWVASTFWISELIVVDLREFSSFVDENDMRSQLKMIMSTRLEKRNIKYLDLISSPIDHTG